MSHKLRLGFTLGVSYDTLGDTGQVSTQVVNPASSSGSVTNVALNGYAFQLFTSGGVQYDILPWLSVGGVVRSPSVRVFGGAGLSYDSLLTSPEGQQQLHFKSTSGNYEFFHPLEIDVGASATFARGAELEVDLRWHMASGTYNLATFPNQSYTIVTTPSGGIPATVTNTFPDLRFGTRALLNAGIGGHVVVSHLLTLNGGFYIDQSPIAPDIHIFQAVDLYGARAGVALTTDTLSGSVGFGYETGQTGRQSSGPGADLASLRIQTLTLLLSIGYKF
jgi:hypothetical protein